jgi:molybdopterin/thiamine biosynthesis adenylyltransferase
MAFSSLRMNSETYERYSRQIRFTGIGETGQEKLLNSGAVLVGCGALGSVAANLLVRAGVGTLRVIDRDFVEPSNLQRQSLYDESDAQMSLPKAVAAERHLKAINSGVKIEGVIGDLTSANATELLTGFGAIVDGTDNFETRLLINDAAISLNIPWVYAAVVAGYGLTMTVQPGETACLACLLESQDGGPISTEDTCDTVGVLNSAVGVIASLEASEAIKILAGKSAALHGRLISCDVWNGRFQSIRVSRNPDCRACGRREFAYLEGEAQPQITMCGRDSVQIHERRRSLDLEELARRLSGTGTEVRGNAFLVRFQVPPHEITVFGDGRAIVKGTKDASVARSLYARFIGA